ncbi:MAG: PAS domain S-box protein [Chitinophagaceae bacterium]|nr:PAS domain S-box protein [Chitinophagaceae bacterium]
MKERSISASRAILLFAFISIIWVLVSDYFFMQASETNIKFYYYQQTFKGLVFVALTAAFIYFILRKNNKTFKNESDALAFENMELETILTESYLGISRFDSEGRFLHANTSFCNIIGYAPEEIRGQHYSLIIKPEDNVELSYWDMLLKQGKLNKMKNLIGITSKTEQKLICNATINEIQHPSGKRTYILSLEDITAKIEEDKKLQENLIRYSILSTSSREGLWDWNILTGQLYYNANLKQLLQYPDSELEKGFEWWKANIHPDDKAAVLKKLEEALQPGDTSTVTNEYRFICGDGNTKIISDCFSIMRDSETRAFRIIVSMQDVTEQHTLQKELEEKEIMYRRQLARTVLDTQENERKKLAEELHDNVNQLLGVVKLYIEHSISNDNIREGLLKKSNEYIDKVIEELRNLSKNLAPPLLAELGLEHSLCSLAETIAPVQDVNITVEMKDFNEECLTDSHKLMLYRIVQEQLNNIIKHSEAENVMVKISKTGNKVLLNISDDGKGADLTAESPVGLGLRNIRNRIELYDGKVDTITSPGKGFELKVQFEV